MALSATQISHLQRLLMGESVAASLMLKGVAEELCKEELLTVRTRGCRRSYSAVNVTALRNYLYTRYPELRMADEASRAAEPEGRSLPHRVLNPGMTPNPAITSDLVMNSNNGSNQEVVPNGEMAFHEESVSDSGMTSDWKLNPKAEQSQDITRARQAAATGDSKIYAKRSCPGFPVNSYQPIACRLHGEELVVYPQEGTFLFIADWSSFCIPAEVIVVGIENMESFRMVRAEQRLFESILGQSPLLFVSRYPQSTDLRFWLQGISNRYVHFGDFDLAGIHIFLTEFYPYLGERSSFLIPHDLEQRLQQGSLERYNDQYQRFSSLRSDHPEFQRLIELIHRYRRGYDQEGYIG